MAGTAYVCNQSTVDIKHRYTCKYSEKRKKGKTSMDEGVRTCEEINGENCSDTSDCWGSTASVSCSKYKYPSQTLDKLSLHLWDIK